MHAMFIFAVVGIAASTTTTWYPTTRAVSKCGAQLDLIVSTCLNSTQLELLACPANDWDCMCTHSSTVLTCFNNCMSDPDRFGFEQTKIANCNAAAVYGIAAKSSATSTTSSNSTLSTIIQFSSTSTTADQSSTRTMTASASETTARETGAAISNAAFPAGGLFAAVFGLAALV